MSNASSIEISFLGGAGSIGASCMLVRAAGTAFLVDCGVRYGGPSPLPDLASLADTRLDAWNGLITINSGGMLSPWGNASRGNSIALAGGTLEVESNGAASWSGPVNVSGTSTIAAPGSGSHTLSGVLSGTGNLTKAGTGALTISGTSANTLSGTTIIDQGVVVLNKSAGVAAIAGPVQMGAGNTNQPHLRMDADNQFAPGVVMTFDNTSGNWTRFDLRGTSQTLAGIVSGNSTTLGSGVVQNRSQGDSGSQHGTATLTLDGSGTYVFNGYLRNVDTGSVGDNLLSLVKQGTGTQTLAGNQITYTGSTTVNDGELVFRNTTSLGATAIANNATVTFHADGNAAFAHSGTRSGAGLFMIDGPGTGTNRQNRVILRGDGANHTGNIHVVNGGKLFLDRGVNAIGDASVVTIDPNGSFFIFSQSGSDSHGSYQVAETIGGLSGSGTVYGRWEGGDIAPKLTVGGGDVSASFGGIIREDDGTRSGLEIVKIGAGTQTLTGANAYTGSTTVDGGTLLVDGSLGNTVVAVNNGGTLGGTGSIGGPTTIHEGGTLAPGSSIGTLRFIEDAPLNLEADSTLAWQFFNNLKEGTTYDTIVGNALHLNVVGNQKINLSIFGLTGNLEYSLRPGDRFTLFEGNVFDHEGTLFDHGADITDLFTITDNIGWWGTWDVTAGSLILTAVPEPGTCLLLLSALACGLLVRRWR